MASGLHLEKLESRNLLAVFPAYIDGQFTLGGTASDGSPYGLENTFSLETNPLATKTIYLDFDGHHSVNNRWGHDIVFPAFNRSGGTGVFTNSELLEIQRVFQNVAEDFAPFDVNVRTSEPPIDRLIRSNGSDQFFGVRSVQTQATSGFGNGIGGVAYLWSFNDDRDNPVFVFNKGANNGAMTVSHEVGHALGLSHDGLNSQEYHPGSGSDGTSWGPIMGAPFSKRITQWSDGDYAGSTTTQNDLGTITSGTNGINYKSDDHAADFAGSTLVPNDNVVFQTGIIERNTDIDTFQFVVRDGRFDVEVRTFQEQPNLDAEATLYDEFGTVIAVDNPIAGTWASFDLMLDAGTYYLSVDGVGRDGRYSDYGSLGFYTIEGTINAINDGDFNADGVLDVADIDLLMEDIYLYSIDRGNPNTFDMSGDGAVDLADRDAWLAEAGAMNLDSGLPYLVADANLDGVVDGQDFIAWNNHKFTATTDWSAGNFNGDSVVDGQDFIAWNDNKFLDSGGGPRVVAPTRLSTLGKTSEFEAERFGDLDVLPEGPFLPLAHPGGGQGEGHGGGHGPGCGCSACCGANERLDASEDADLGNLSVGATAANIIQVDPRVLQPQLSVVRSAAVGRSLESKDDEPIALGEGGSGDWLWARQSYIV